MNYVNSMRKFAIFYLYGVLMLPCLAYGNNKTAPAEKQNLAKSLEKISIRNDISLPNFQKAVLYHLKEQSKDCKNATKFQYSSKPYSTPIEDYIRSGKSDYKKICSHVLQILKFVQPYLNSPDTDSRKFTIYAITSLVKGLEELPSQSKQIKILTYAVAKAWLFPCLYYHENSYLNSVTAAYADVMERHINLARQLGKPYYSYACRAYDIFIPKCRNKNLAAQARCYYWQSWMYLNLKDYNKCIRSVRKIPKVKGMENVSKTFNKWISKSK